MNKREKPKAIVTPVGVAKYANISKPKLNFKKTGEEYSVDMLFEPGDEINQFTAQVKQMADAAKAKAIEEAKTGKEKKALETYRLYIPIENEVDKDGNETGKIILKAKNSASYQSREKETIKRTIPLFDAKGKPVANVNIGRGSQLKISVVPNTFVNPSAEKVGVSLWLKAVQIIKLEEFGGGTADSFGFAEEDGYAVGAEQGETVVAGGGEGDPNF